MLSSGGFQVVTATAAPLSIRYLIDPPIAGFGSALLRVELSQVTMN